MPASLCDKAKSGTLISLKEMICGDGHRFGHLPDLSGAQIKFLRISRLLHLRI
jgi:hypothetical protein